MPEHLNTFAKEERLSGVTAINSLFENGKTRLVYPVKIIYLKKDFSRENPARAAFTIGKKKFKKAVDRNLLKRRMREAYRLNKRQLAGLNDKSLDVMFVYIAAEILPYQTIEKSIIHLIKKLAK